MGMWFAAGACIALWAIVVHGTWGNALAILVGLVFLLGYGFFSAMEFVGDGRRDAAKIAELEKQLAERDQQLAEANEKVNTHIRHVQFKTSGWEQQLEKYAADVRSLDAELARKDKLIEALQKGAPQIPKADDDAIKKLFR